MVASISSASLLGTTGEPVGVEVDVANGLPSFTVVGLPDAAVRESRDRVRAALVSSGFSWPSSRITVNLAPSGVRKGGAGFDLPIAMGILVASGQVPGAATMGAAFVGELGLDGAVRHVPGMVSLADAAVGSRMVMPLADVAEARLVRTDVVGGFGDLGSIVAALMKRTPWPTVPSTPTGVPKPPPPQEPDLSEVKGQRVGRRAIEIAAAGGHHLLLVGPPGSGKTMLARRLCGLLPDLSEEEALEVCRISSAAGQGLPANRRPPFRSPHHGASAVALLGGGSTTLRPGEISLASQGVLFLDEMGEYPVAVLEALRQPLEEGVVRVSRFGGMATFPARFLLVGAMNPCPCGEGSVPGRCRCTPASRARYARRLSSPFLDRFDMVVPLSRPEPDELVAGRPGEATSAVARRVGRARRIPSRRGIRVNAELSVTDLDEKVPMSREARKLVESEVRCGSLTARGLHRIHRVARTIADLDGAPAVIDECHVAEALALRAARGTILVPECPQ